MKASEVPSKLELASIEDPNDPTDPNYSNDPNENESHDKKIFSEKSISKVHKYLNEVIKPGRTYSELIAEALQNSSSGMLTLSDIYVSVSARYPYYKIGDSIWKKSLRDTLRLQDKKIDKSFTKVSTDKDTYWTFSQMHLDFKEKKLLPKPIDIDTEKHRY